MAVAPTFKWAQEFAGDVRMRVGESRTNRVPFEANPPPQVSWSCFAHLDKPRAAHRSWSQGSRRALGADERDRQFDAAGAESRGGVGQRHVPRVVGERARCSVARVRALRDRCAFGVNTYLLQLRSLSDGDAGCELVCNMTDKPGAPQRGRVSEMNGEHCVVEWEPPRDTGGAPVSYVLELRDLSRRTSEQLATTSETSFSVEHLQVGKSYAFAVAAVNEAGRSSSFEIAAVTAKYAFAAPPAPSKPLVRPIEEEAVAAQVSWTMPLEWSASSNDETTVRFELERKRASENKWTSAGLDALTDTSCKVSGLREDDSYTFRVLASNKAGTSTSEAYDVLTYRKSYRRRTVMGGARVFILVRPILSKVK